MKALNSIDNNDNKESYKIPDHYENFKHLNFCDYTTPIGNSNRGLVYYDGELCEFATRARASSTNHSQDGWVEMLIIKNRNFDLIENSDKLPTKKVLYGNIIILAIDKSGKFINA